MQQKPAVNFIFLKYFLKSPTTVLPIFIGTRSGVRTTLHFNPGSHPYSLPSDDKFVFSGFEMSSGHKLVTYVIDRYGLRKYFKSCFSNNSLPITRVNNRCSLIFNGIDETRKFKSIVYFNILLAIIGSQSLARAKAKNHTNHQNQRNHSSGHCLTEPRLTKFHLFAPRKTYKNPLWPQHLN